MMRLNEIEEATEMEMTEMEKAGCTPGIGAWASEHGAPTKNTTRRILGEGE